MHTSALLLFLLTSTSSAAPPPSATSPVWSTFPPVVAGPTTSVTRVGASTAATAACPDDDEWVATSQPSACVHIATHRPRRVDGDVVPTLVVFLHADLYPVVLDSGFLRWLARTAPQAVVVGLLRPGFRDADGHETPVVARHGFGDAYLREDALVVGGAIAALKDRHHARRVVVVGSSGGAAIAANVAALSAGLVDDAVVASCPCDLAAWREHRVQTSPTEALASAWRQPFRSLSPLSTAPLVPATTRVTLIAGERDANTPPSVHGTYLTALQTSGVGASLHVVDGSGHGVLDAPRARQLVREILDASSTTSLASVGIDAAPGAGFGAPSVRDAP